MGFRPSGLRELPCACGQRLQPAIELCQSACVCYDETMGISEKPEPRRPLGRLRLAILVPWILVVASSAAAVKYYSAHRSDRGLAGAILNERETQEERVRLGIANVMRNQALIDVFEILGTEVDRSGDIWIYALWRSWNSRSWECAEHPTQRQQDIAARAMVAEFVTHDARKVQIFVFLHPSSYAEYLETRNLRLVTNSVRARAADNWRVEWRSGG